MSDCTRKRRRRMSILQAMSSSVTLLALVIAFCIVLIASPGKLEMFPLEFLKHAGFDAVEPQSTCTCRGSIRVPSGSSHFIPMSSDTQEVENSLQSDTQEVEDTFQLSAGWAHTSTSENLSSPHVLPADNDAFMEEAGGEVGYPVCLAINVGDNEDLSNQRALQFSSLYRLFSAMMVEVDAIRDSQSMWKNFRYPKAVLVVVDFPEIPCRMIRDSLEESQRNVALNCQALLQLRREEPISCRTLITGNATNKVPQITLDLVARVVWQDIRIVDMTSLDPTKFLPANLTRELWRPTIVTGFSSNHLAVGLLLLRSLGKAGQAAAAAEEYNISIVIWTMEDFVPEHQAHLDCVVREVNDVYRVPTEVRSHNFSAYPFWTRIDQKRGHYGRKGEYAWKAVMIHQVLLERGFLLWIDAGSRVDHGSLVETLDSINRNHFASRKSPGNLPKWTHPLQFQYLRFAVPKVPVRNCDASVIGITLAKYSELMRPWYECSMTRQCIAPDGSTRANHRQDQSALTILSLLSDNPCQGVSMNLRRHLDSDGNDLWGTDPSTCYNDPLVV